MAVALSGLSQCLNTFFFTHRYNCLSQGSVISYTLTGGVGPYSCTVVNTANNATAAVGPSSGGIGTITAVPTGSYLIYIGTGGGCTATAVYQVNVSNTASNSVIQTTNACFGTQDGKALIIPPTSFTPAYTAVITPTAQLSFPNVNGLSPNVVYTLNLTDAQGCTASRTFSVGEFNQISSQFSNTFVTCFGGTVNTVLTSTGGTTPYTYSLNGTQKPASGNLGAGTYTVVTRSANGCSATQTMLIDQGPQVVISFSVTQPACSYSKNGVISATASGGYGGPYTYTWLPVASAASTVGQLGAGTYSLAVSDMSLCTSNSAVILFTPQPLQSTVVTAPENCSAADGGFTISYSGGTPPYTYSTAPGSYTATSVAGIHSGRYVTLLTDAAGCADTARFTVGNLSTVSLAPISSVQVSCYGLCDGSIQMSAANAVPPVSYSINGNAVASAAIGSICAGTHTVTASDNNGCPAEFIFSYQSPAAISVSATPPAVICVGSSASLTADASGGVPPFTFLWSPPKLTGSTLVAHPDTTTTYSVQAFDSKGCGSAVVTVTAVVRPPLQILTGSSKTGICPGSSTQITPTVTGGDGSYTYSWLPTGETQPTLAIKNAAINSFTLTVNDGCGSPAATSVIPLGIFPRTIPVIKPSLTTGCPPLRVVFEDLTKGTASVLWNFGNPDELAGKTVTNTFAQTGRFSVAMSFIDSNNCRMSHTFADLISVKPRPAAAFTTAPSEITLSNSENVTLKNLSNGGVSWRWEMDGRYLTDETSPRTTFADTGTYEVKLIAFNEGCADTAINYIRVSEGFNFFMPEAFTPNGDGINDQLIPVGTGWLTSGYQLIITDRWGYDVFRTRDTTKAWDGEARGLSGRQDGMNDVYWWRAEINDLQNKKHFLQGHVLLIR